MLLMGRGTVSLPPTLPRSAVGILNHELISSIIGIYLTNKNYFFSTFMYLVINARINLSLLLIRILINNDTIFYHILICEDKIHMKFNFFIILDKNSN